MLSIYKVFWYIVIAIVLIIITTIYLQLDYAITVAEWIEPRVIWRAPPALAGQRIALTIDDIPCKKCEGGSSLAGILRVLRKHDVSATLFLMSEEKGIREHALLLEQALKDGHEFGNHTIHDEPSVFLSKKNFEVALEHGERTIKSLGQTTKNGGLKWFRPGTGMWTNSMLRELTRRDYTMVLGNIYPNFSWLNSVAYNVWYICSRARNGGIIILHDRPWTPAVLDIVLPRLKKQFQVTSLTKLLNK